MRGPKFPRRKFNSAIFEYPNGAALVLGLREIPGYNWTGPLLRIRRSSDNAEEVFYQGATPGTFNTIRGGGGTSLQAWAAGNSYYKTFYDQSGNSNDVSETIAGDQMQCTDGSGNLLLANSKAAILSYAQCGPSLTTPINSSEPYTILFVGKKTNATDRLMILSGRTGGYITISHYSNEFYYLESNAGTVQSNNTVSNTTQQIIIGVMNGATRFLESNTNTIPSTFSANPRSLNFEFFGGLKDFGNGSTGYLQEFIIWKADKSSELIKIRNAANNYYNAY